MPRHFGRILAGFAGAGRIHRTTASILSRIDGVRGAGGAATAGTARASRTTNAEKRRILDMTDTSFRDGLAGNSASPNTLDTQRSNVCSKEVSAAKPRRTPLGFIGFVVGIGLVLMSWSPAIGSGETCGKPQDSPLWRDRFDGLTRGRAESGPVSGKTPSLTMSALWLSGSPDIALLTFSGSWDEWRYLDCHATYLLVDGKLLRLVQEADHRGDVNSGGVVEFVHVAVSWKDLKRMGVASQVEYKICNDEFVVPQTFLCALQNLVQAVEKWKSPNHGSTMKVELE